MSTVTKGQRTRAAIVNIGLQVWREQPDKLTLMHIASLVGVTHGTVLYHFKTIDDLKAELVSAAIRTGDKVIVPQLIAQRHPATADMLAEVKSGYLSLL